MAFTGTLTGNLGQDPQMRYTDSGKALLQQDTKPQQLTAPF